MVTTIAMSPAMPQSNCLDRKPYGEPKRWHAITAEAENTITRPTNTSSMVTVNNQRSTLTRFAMGTLISPRVSEEGLWIVENQVLSVLVRGNGLRVRPSTRAFFRSRETEQVG